MNSKCLQYNADPDLRQFRRCGWPGRTRKDIHEGRKGKNISTKGHEEQRRATKGLEEAREGSAKGRGLCQGEKDIHEGRKGKKISTKGHEERRRATKGLEEAR